MSKPSCLVSLYGVLALLSPVVTAAAQAPTDTIRGRVTGPTGTPIANASIHVTRAPDRVTRKTATQADGTYLIVFSDGTGDYLVNVAAPTFETFRKRVSGPAHIFVVDAQLAAAEGTLAAVVVYGHKDRPERGASRGVAVGASEQFVDGVRGAIPALDRGNVNALAAVTPGIVSVGGGISALGLPASQAQVTLNGLAFAGASVPRDAKVRTRVSTSTYDPARGGFASAEIALELAPGGIYSERTGHVTLEPFSLQLPGRDVAALGGRYSAADVGIGGNGELVRGKLYYSASGEISRRLTPVPTVDQANAGALGAYGLAPDSVTTLLNAAHALGIPLTAPESRSAEVATSGTVLFRVDHTPAATRTWSITGYLNAAQNAPLEVSPLATQAHESREQLSVASLSGTSSFYTRSNWLNETRFVVSRTADLIEPLVHYPDITVDVNSPSANGLTATAPVLLGADNAIAQDAHFWTIQGLNQTIANVRGTSHQVKVTAESRADLYQIRDAANALGTFIFASPQQLANGTPSVFTRTLGSPTVQGGTISGAMSVGDFWQARPTLQFLYGLRLEGESFVGSKPLGPLVQKGLHVNTNALPSSVGISPRLGFTWFYRTGENTGGDVSNALGSFYQRGTSGSLRGGIGEFRSRSAPTLLATAQRQSGTDASGSAVTCAGVDAPAIQWSTLAADPENAPFSCRAGADAASVGTSPNVYVLDPASKPPRSWRSNLAWTGSARDWIVSVEGIYSLNLDQPSNQDINFSATPQFTLGGEQSRPVYVPVASVDPNNGAISIGASRRSAQLGTVVERSTAARSITKQLTLSIAPQQSFSDTRYYSFSYTLSRTMAQLSGIDGTTFTGQPALAWMISPLDVTHQFLVQGGMTLPHVGVATIFARVASGRPYTPIVDADINGDGFINDRAFVGIPAPGDTAGQRAFAHLQSGAPGVARACIRHSLGRVATPDGCRTGWTQTVNAQLSISNALLHLNRRADVSIQLNNVLAGVDRALHGANRLSGWGAPDDVDPVLFHVERFDPITRDFTYVVNQNFGRPRGLTSLLANPFRVTFDVSMDLGLPVRVQLLERALGAGRHGDRGPRLTPKQLQTRYERSIPDVYSYILFNSDSLLLSTAQLRALDSAHVVYRAATDSVWAPLAQHLASLGESFDAAQALRDADEATNRVWAIVRRQALFIESVLTPVQRAILPQMVRSILTSPTPIRISTSY